MAEDRKPEPQAGPQSGAPHHDQQRTGVGGKTTNPDDSLSEGVETKHIDPGRTQGANQAR